MLQCLCDYFLRTCGLRVARGLERSDFLSID